MLKNTKVLITIIASVIIGLLSACGAQNKSVSQHNMTNDISGLVQDVSVEPTILYIRPNVPTLADYNSFIIDPVKVDYSDQNMRDLDAEDLTKVKEYFRNKVASELSDSGYQIATQPGNGTMRISFTLSGIKVPNASANIIGILAPIALSVGEVTVEAAFSESVSNRIDAVAINRSQGSRVLNATAWSTWADVESAFDVWAKGIREGVDEAHGK